MKPVDFLALNKINEPFKEQFVKTVLGILENGQYLFGPKLTEFERAFSRFCGVNGSVGVANGLDALTISLLAWKTQGLVSQGDEVLVPANSFIASALAVIESGLKPVFVEPNRLSYNLEASECQKHITSRTRVIMPVHLYGSICQMEEICNLARENNLLVLEDCAQAHGAKLDEINAGAWGDAGAFSFYPGKNLGGVSDGGAIVSNDEDFLRRCRAIGNYGSEKKYAHHVAGINSRMSEITAAFLELKLQNYSIEVKKRRHQADLYLNNIEDNILTKNFGLDVRNDIEGRHVFHLFVVEHPKRESLIAHLSENKIKSGIHYPMPIYRQKAFLNYAPEEVTLSDEICRQVLSLPIGSHLEDEEIMQVCSVLNSYESR